MTKQEMKDFLSRYPLLLKEIARKQQEAEDWKKRLALASDSAVLNVQQAMDGDFENLFSLKKEIETLIGSVENHTYRLLLAYRYLDGKTWEETADCMHYCWQHLHRMHNKAIEELIHVMECDCQVVV